MIRITDLDPQLRPEQSENYLSFAVSVFQYLNVVIITFILPKGTHDEETRMNKKTLKNIR